MIKNNNWTIVNIISWTTKYFQKNGIENSRLEIEWLLCHLLFCKRIDLYLQFEKNLDKTNINRLKSMIQRRVSGEPFQHIIQKGTFYGRDFYVDSNVLIPRPETELIIERLKNIPTINSLLDVGTGSGCIAITCYLEKIGKKIFASDISNKALEIAKKNAESYKISNINFHHHNFLTENLEKKFDVIVSNPPYIESSKIKDLSLEVKKFEPHIALTDNYDGLSFYRRFAAIFHKIVNKKGLMVLEINNRIDINKIATIFFNQSLKISIFKDLQKDNRVIEVYE